MQKLSNLYEQGLHYLPFKKVYELSKTTLKNSNKPVFIEVKKHYIITDRVCNLTARVEKICTNGDYKLCDFEIIKPNLVTNQTSWSTNIPRYYSCDNYISNDNILPGK